MTPRVSSSPPARQPPPPPLGAGFTLLEVLISLVVLTIGLLTLLSILQKTLRASEPVEFETRAALLAQSVLEGIRSDPGGFPFLPGVNPGTWPVVERSIYQSGDPLLIDENGDPFDLNRTTQPSGHQGVPARLNLPLVFTVPGNGVDDDALIDDTGRWVDQEQIARGPNGIPTVLRCPDCRDGLDDQMGQFFLTSFRQPPGALSSRDYDGNIQEDVNEFFIGRISPTQLFPNPDNDHDGDGLPFDSGDSAFADEGFAQAVQDRFGLFPDGDLSYDPQRGIDEEFANGRDDDRDSLIDEDLTLPSQFQPILNPSGVDPMLIPYNYQPTLAGNNLDDDGDGEAGSPVDPKTGKKLADGIDNDGDGRIDEREDSNNTNQFFPGFDEETWDGEDNDDDGRVDEDCNGTLFPYNPMPFPPPNEEYSLQISVRRVPVAGDGLDNDSAPGQLPNLTVDEEFANSWDDDLDGFADEDLREFPASNSILVTVFVFQGDDRQDNDGDGWIDEEALDGLDNDRDAPGGGSQGVDEDVYRRVFRTTGLVRVR